jgi:hypothetical protein
MLQHITARPDLAQPREALVAERVRGDADPRRVLQVAVHHLDPALAQRRADFAVDVRLHHRAELQVAAAEVEQRRQLLDGELREPVAQPACRLFEHRRAP